jgi:threonine synthase
MKAELVCIEKACGAAFPITEVLYNCPHCGGLLETVYRDLILDVAALQTEWREVGRPTTC